MANEALMSNIPFVNIEENEIRIEFTTQPALLIKLQPFQNDTGFLYNALSLPNLKTENNFQVCFDNTSPTETTRYSSSNCR